MSTDELVCFILCKHQYIYSVYLLEHNFSATIKAATSEIRLSKWTAVLGCGSITNVRHSVSKCAVPAPPHQLLLVFLSLCVRLCRPVSLVTNGSVRGTAELGVLPGAAECLFSLEIFCFVFTGEGWLHAQDCARDWRSAGHCLPVSASCTWLQLWRSPHTRKVTGGAA